MLTRQSLSGIWATVLLPYEASGRIHWSELERDLAILTAAGVDGLYMNGSAAEFFSQNDDEYLQIAHLVAHASRQAGIPFQVGASHPIAEQTLHRIRLALPLNPDGFQVIFPDWFPLRFKEAVAFLKRVAEVAQGTSLVLYLPPHAKTKLTPAELGELGREIPSLVGVKVAGGDEAWYEALKTNGVDMAVFVAGHRLATGVLHGARGSYSNIACLHPARAVRWYQMMRQDSECALAVEKELQGFIKEHVAPLCQNYCDAAIDKLLAYAGGWTDRLPELRWPYAAPSEDEARAIRRVLPTAIPQFLAIDPSPIR